MFVDDERVELGPREWSPRARNLNIYWYADFPSMERVGYGLAILEKGPKSKWIDSNEIGEVGFSEPIAMLMDIGDALKYLGKGDKGRWAFEEVPYGEIKTKDDYNRALLAAEDVEGFDEISPGERERIVKFELDKKNYWKGPGVYDFRDMTRSYKSVEEYEKDSMEYWASDVLDSGYEDDWESALRELLERNIV